MSKRKPDLTSLHIAAMADDARAIRRLLADGADANARDVGGMTPLHLAASRGHAESAAVLCEAGADVNARDDESATPLHYAAREYHPEVVRILLDARAAVDPVDRFGNTPLWRAVYGSQGRGDVIELLVEAGADPDRANASGVAPRSLARLIANYDVKRFFGE